MLALLYKELYVFFRSTMAYVVIGIFLLVLGLFLWFFPTQFNILDSGVAWFEPMFNLAPWLLMLFLPAITMRSIAEEKKQGTLEFLITKPLSEGQIVLAKYLASLIILLVSLLPTLVYFITVQYFISNRMVDTGAFWSGMLGLFLLGAAFSAIGIWASANTNNQVVAFILALTVELIMFWGFDLLSNLPALRPVAQLLSRLSLNFNYQPFSKGVIDTRNLIYMLSVIAAFLWLAISKLKHRD